MHCPLQALTAALAPKALAVRDGTVQTIDAVTLVPGDVLIIRLGNIVPADVKILEEEGEGGGEEVPMQVKALRMHACTWAPCTCARTHT